jgi:ABC-2 type transport system permease protein
MKLERVWVIFQKELSEIARSKMILITMMLLPGLLVSIALFTEHSLMQLPDEVFDATGAPAELVARFEHLGPRLAVIALLNEQFLSMLLMIAAALPSTIAAHSVIGEKVERTLEPLLATPVTTQELLLAKTLVASVPAILLTWIAFAVTVGGIAAWAPPEALELALRPVWPLAFLFVAPLLSFASVMATLALSSRVNDPRTAQGVSAFLILPLAGVGVSALAGAITIDILWVFWAVAFLFLADLLLLRVVSWLFGRETILTRWR